MELLHVSQLDAVTHPAHGYQQFVLADVVATLADESLEHLVDVARLTLLCRLAQLVKHCSVIRIQGVDSLVNLVSHRVHHVRAVVLDKHVSLVHSSNLLQELLVVHETLIRVLGYDLQGLGRLEDALGYIEDDVDEIIFSNASLLVHILCPELCLQLTH